MTSSPAVPYRHYDYLLKFLLVGDSDVGKDEILDSLDDEKAEPSFCSLQAIAPKTTTILLEGKRVKLQLWDASGQGRFATIIRSYSRGAQGVLVVYDITNRWSFDGIARWLKEIDEQVPGIPKILIGNRLHLEFGRRVTRQEAEHFAAKKQMEYFEVSPLASFNIRESLTELSRLVLSRIGMERLWKNNRVLSLQEACCRCVVRHLGGTVHDVDRLPLPVSLQLQIRSYADSSQLMASNSVACTSSTIRRRTTAGGGFLLQHKRSGSDVSAGGGIGGRRSCNAVNGGAFCGGGGGVIGPGSYLTIPNGNFNIQGRLSNGHRHHHRSISAVMSPLWNKLHRNHSGHHNSSSSTSTVAAAPNTPNATAIRSQQTSQSSSASNAAPPPPPPSVNAPPPIPTADSSNSRHSNKENCLLM